MRSEQEEWPDKCQTEVVRSQLAAFDLAYRYFRLLRVYINLGNHGLTLLSYSAYHCVACMKIMKIDTASLDFPLLLIFCMNSSESSR